MKYSLFISFFFFSLSCFSQDMTNQFIEKILSENLANVKGSAGGWEATVENRPLLIVTDEAANRMRIFTFVTELSEIHSTEMELLLRANFTNALDAKYAIYDGLVISVFTHPLREMTKAQFLDAIKQVNNLAENFGTTYSSTDIHFGLEWEKESYAEKRINIKPSYRGKKN